MNIHPLFMLVVLTVISAILDAAGFAGGPKAWINAIMQKGPFMLAWLAFAGGAGVYLYSIRFYKVLGIESAEIPTLIWFMTTIIGMALISGRFMGWPNDAKIASLISVALLGYVIVRTGG